MLKHRSGMSNRVADALSRRQLLLTIMQVEVVGFDELKNLYPKDLDIVEAWKACKEPVTLDKIRWLDYLIQDGMFFKGSQLCIPRSSIRENLIKEKHSRGMVGHLVEIRLFTLLENIIFGLNCHRM